MIIGVGGYTINYISSKNKIEIALPQTVSTLTSTTGVLSDRKVDITDRELYSILCRVITVFESNEIKNFT